MNSNHKIKVNRNIQLNNKKKWIVNNYQVYYLKMIMYYLINKN